MPSVNAKASEIPLLSRGEVLFPGTVTRIRLADARQMGQLRTASGGCFGFSLFIPAKGEHPAQHMRLGTEAVIEDYNQDEAGGLQLKLRGKRRFLIRQTRCLHDGQLVVRPEWLAEEEPRQLPVDYATMAQVVARYMEQVQPDYPQYKPLDCEDASFVGFRLAELLPMELEEKQMLLELTDPILRLRMLSTILPRFQPA